MSITRMRSVHDCVADCAVPGEKVLADAEAAYRRGFFQGAMAALQAVDGGVPTSQLNHWLTWLKKWRVASRLWLRGSTVVAVYPPDPEMTPGKPSRRDTPWFDHPLRFTRSGKP